MAGNSSSLVQQWLKKIVSNEFICRSLSVHLVFESFVHCIFINSAKGKCIAVYAMP